MIIISIVFFFFFLVLQKWEAGEEMIVDGCENVAMTGTNFFCWCNMHIFSK